MSDTQSQKSAHALREEATLAYWKEHNIFQKTLERELHKDKFKGEFVFYEGPPTANGRPGIHHLEARAFKDAIPRYRTMCGYHVRRKGGWDTHGLPVELAVEKALGLKSKKEIESYGIAAFNEKCKDDVWKYVHEWEGFTDRMGYWVDIKNPYVTYRPAYIEALWNIVSKIHSQDLLYKDYKVVPWCPRCGTALSSHELAQGYQMDKDLAVTVKFQVTSSKEIPNPKSQIPNKLQIPNGVKTFLLAWTTTPWTLPGNVGLAVGSKIEYVLAKNEDGTEYYIFAVPRTDALKKFNPNLTTVQTISGADLVGLSYEPLYPFLKDNIAGAEKEKLPNAYKVYAADFVTTEDGTGIVHTAVMYGQEDFELGTKVGLPKYHLVNDDGTFKAEAGFLAGKFVKDEATAVDIIKDLANRPSGSLLFAKEKYEHSYPHCWRCNTPLIYFARDSWYIRMSSLRDKLVRENEHIHWEPDHIKEGRFGEWLREIKDWAISRERYWGTPLPVWVCDTCKKLQVAGSVAEISKPARNRYTVMRHGEAENNVRRILSGDAQAPHHLTEKGKSQVRASAEELKKSGKQFDLVFVSPFVRTQETMAIVREVLGFPDAAIITDDRLRELGSGTWNGRDVGDFIREFMVADRFVRCPEGGENYADIKTRMGDFIFELEEKYNDKTILIITHETPACLMYAAATGMDRQSTMFMRDDHDFLLNAETKEIPLVHVPHNPEYELDLHRPYIDAVTMSCSCGGTMKRVREVMDVWFDSGAMPFAQDHVLGEWPHESKLKKLFGAKDAAAMPYPADFISEAIDQTRGWFYTLHAIGILMGRGHAYKNVVCLGLILDKEGKKMSKSVGNVVNPFDMMDKYGADALRFWMYSVNQPGDSKNFDEKTVDEIIKKVFNLITNVVAFYKLYDGGSGESEKESQKKIGKNVLDKWIITRLNQLLSTVTKGLDSYVFLEPTRAIRDFVADLSQWYLRRSRDRFKSSDLADRESACSTTRYVLLTLSKVMAPFTPFFAEHIYREGLGGPLESVHLEFWPEGEAVDEEVLKDMNTVRQAASRGLEARSSAKINVRQPLQKLTVKAEAKLSDEYLDVIRDEVNVKEVIFDPVAQKDVELDLTITPALKEEGMLRELLRLIQDLRKEKGLSVRDVATLVVQTGEEGRTFIGAHANEIKTACTLRDVTFGDITGDANKVGEIEFRLAIK